MKSKRLSFFVLVLSLSLFATDKSPETYNRFIGTSAFILVNLIPNQDDPPNFFQLNAGIKVSPKDVVSIEAITWKFNKPLGFVKSGDEKERFPGYVREFGIGGAYQRFIWRGAYSAVHLLPLVTLYSEEGMEKTQKGFKLFTTLRMGYHFDLFKNRIFVEPSFAATFWPVNSNRPASFKSADKTCTAFALEPGLHLGFQF